MKKIKLTKGKFALVDDKDFEFLNKTKWYFFKPRHSFYAQTSKGVSMHREILKPPKGMIVDHIDGNGLNNQRKNLRIVTNRQNCQNQRLKKLNTSGFKGIFLDKRVNKWQAHIRIKGKVTFLGIFKIKEDAARAYDKAAVKHFGEFALTNKKLGAFDKVSDALHRAID